MNKSELDRYRSQGASALVDAYERLVGERDAIAAHVERLCEKITEYHSEDVAAEDALNDLAVIVADIPNQSLVERDTKTEEAVFHALYYAPSSPVKPDKAHEIKEWYGKLKESNQLRAEAKEASDD